MSSLKPTAGASPLPLTPLHFLERSAQVFPTRTAIVDGDRRFSYREFADEAARVASALITAGIKPGDKVAYLAPNQTELLIGHFAVPLARGVIVAINTRLAPEEIRYILEHSEARLLIVDQSLVSSVAPVADQLQDIRLVTVTDGSGQVLGTPYSEFIESGGQHDLSWEVDDELETIAINYTSGTTGRPKGVMYTHRGATLGALAGLHHSGFSSSTAYLWTLPMFHCNGWCTAWALAASGGRQVCLPAVRADQIWQLIDEEGITHLNGAPTVLTTIANAPEAHVLTQPLTITTAGAPPSPTTIAEIKALGASIVHVYGLTETYGPYTVCELQESWSDLDQDAHAEMLSRQGVGMLHAGLVRVVDEAMADVPADGETMGEIVMRGNVVMSGYFKDPEGTAKAFHGGWFHSGDLGVMHPDGYVQLRDRAKDVVISGGENISTVEVEQALISDPRVLETAVIGVPDEKWGEVTKAFVVLKPNVQASAEELIEHVRSRIARYKAPKTIAFVSELPKTSTGKVQKFALREQA
ncbi:MAG: long-chain-fatty-acid--CoA ligase [Solirubrobacterales bacterium]|nr:long-chain-fatty-acid--CoA ligase [Solirubrobacterales bacterium]